MRRALGKGLYVSAIVLWLVGCGSGRAYQIRNLVSPSPGRGSNNAIVREVSLRESKARKDERRIFSALVDIKNTTGQPIDFGPRYVHLADNRGNLFSRISERWLTQYYQARLRDLPVPSLPDALIPFASQTVQIGVGEFSASPLTPDQKKKWMAGLAELAEAVFVVPQKEAPGSIIDKGYEVALGVPLAEKILTPGLAVAGYVYFYHPAGERPVYPLRLMVDVGGYLYTFLFQEG